MSDAVIKGLEKAQAFLASIPRAAEIATSRALNRAAAQGRDEAVKAIDQRYAVRPSDVREKIQLYTSTPDSLSISITSRSPSLSLGYFPHSPTVAGTGGRGKPALRAEVIRGQQRTVASAFVATINGKSRIMMRTGGKTATGKSKIRSVYSVPIATMLGSATVRAAVMRHVEAAFEKHLEREIDAALGRST